MGILVTLSLSKKKAPIGRCSAPEIAGLAPLRLPHTQRGERMSHLMAFRMWLPRTVGYWPPTFSVCGPPLYTRSTYTSARYSCHVSSLNPEPLAAHCPLPTVRSAVDSRQSVVTLLIVYSRGRFTVEKNIFAHKVASSSEY